MASAGQPIRDPANPQQSGFGTEENPRTYTLLNDVPLMPSNEITHEQQIIYYNPPTSYQTVNNLRPNLYAQQPMNSQIVNQPPATYIAPQHYHYQYQQQQQQYKLPSMHMPNPSIHQTSLHANMDQQRMLFLSHQPSGNTAIPPPSSMTIPTESSTPISTAQKRNRNDLSGISESNIQLRPQYPQSTRLFQPNNIKRPRREQREQREQIDSNDNVQQPSIAACRFAATRYPFSPFSVTFSDEVREKAVLDDLFIHAKENHNFELKTVAYRRGRSDENEYRILIFVENSESFAFLYDQSNWPTSLANSQFIIKCPSIPPQLSLALPVVSLQTDWNEFVQEVKERYPGIANIIRLKNKAQQPVRAVKLECLSVQLRNDLLAAGEVSAMHMKFKVVEFFSQANVLICSNCYQIGHFRKNCPQKDEATCKTCGEKSTNLKDHQCSGVLKCIHCGESHASNDAKCMVVKDYRAALTRNLLNNAVPINARSTNVLPSTTTHPSSGFLSNRLPYAAVLQTAPSNSNDDVLNKLDAVITKVEEESTNTRRSIEAVKEEWTKRYDETYHQVNLLENKLVATEKNFADVITRLSTIMQNICSSLLNPQGSQGVNWKSYWQEQIEALTDFRSFISKSLS